MSVISSIYDLVDNPRLQAANGHRHQNGCHEAGPLVIRSQEVLEEWRVVDWKTRQDNADDSHSNSCKFESLLHSVFESRELGHLGSRTRRLAYIVIPSYTTRRISEDFLKLCKTSQFVKIDNWRLELDHLFSSSAVSWRLRLLIIVERETRNWESANRFGLASQPRLVTASETSQTERIC